ncbi:hypothetical protein E5288_WYG011863 [Bos mutus]|uniref:Uncharacterized protein n=1 Tax=Bos mutus TaxID=72004 RepID=A0A6B0QUT5_9CETA|nr:hypothetical protein [Bos mutus]
MPLLQRLRNQKGRVHGLSGEPERGGQQQALPAAASRRQRKPPTPRPFTVAQFSTFPPKAPIFHLEKRLITEDQYMRSSESGKELSAFLKKDRDSILLQPKTDNRLVMLEHPYQPWSEHVGPGRVSPSINV